MAVEAEPDPGVPFHVDEVTILLRGKIDRIDHNPESGAWAIFDYKTGDGGGDPEEVHRKGRGEARRWVDLQLPLYRLLLKGILTEDGRPLVPEDRWSDVKLGFILLPRMLDRVGASLAGWTEEELAQAEEAARKVVRELLGLEIHYDPTTSSYRNDPLDPLLGRTLLPLAEGEEEGDGGW